MRLKAAVYARKSTEQTVADDAKSVTRQIELARGFAIAKGWVVDKAHVYTDDGISGALATKLLSRARMLAAAANEEFSVLIVRDVDRLSRSDEELPGLVYTLRDAGVDIWCYGDGARVDTATALSRGMLSMRATFAAAEREAAQTRTREAARSRAQKGYVTGGRCYGYTNVGQPKERRREINEREAEVIRRIFQLTADGLGLHRICQTLNTEAVAAPTAHGWVPMAVSHMLHRDIYRGKSVVGRTTWSYRKGRKVKTLVEDPARLITLEQPELRIVSDALWASAHARVARTRQVFQGRTKGTPRLRLDSGLASTHLLSGFLSCGVCHGGLFVAHRGRKGYPKLYYVCTTYHKRGTSHCTNRHGVPYDAITQKVVSHFNPEAIREYISEKLTENWRDTKPALNETKTRLQQDLKRLDRELANLTDAVKAGGGSVKALVEALQTAQTKRDTVTAHLEHVEGLEKASEGAVELDTAALEALATLQDEYRQHPLTASPSTFARTVLRFLLPEPIAVTPILEGGKLKEWSYLGRGVYDRILTGHVFKELADTTALLPSWAR